MEQGNLWEYILEGGHDGSFSEGKKDTTGSE